jgi:hypothetical protein
VAVGVGLDNRHDFDARSDGGANRMKVLGKLAA